MLSVKLAAILGAALFKVRFTLQPITIVNFVWRIFFKPLLCWLLHVFLLELFIYLRIQFVNSWARFLSIEKLIIK